MPLLAGMGATPQRRAKAASERSRYGALLIDLWSEMELPEPMRTHWAAVVEATLHAPIATDSEQYRRDDDTRRTPLNVVRHADS